MNNKMTEENMEKKANSNLDNNEEAVDLNQDTTQEETNEPQEQQEQTEEETQTVEENLAQQLEELKDKYLRTVAEFENFKRRTLKEKTELILNGGEKAITAILPIIDDMERAIENAHKQECVDAVEEGWELIYKKLLSTLEGMGVKKIEVEDKDFDVDYHEAVAMVPGMGDDKKGKIIDCVQTGYTLNDKVIRHAKVAVGQ
ncbi:nucleotide exchange factor GrpE [Hoylesella loescheii]|uniref:Protein GrpE n=1 Tax=Hoylesella loescheii DSM 19665 = JCM 12249 = ATCC 15930 TaxID=1122985 RepID=A0A069QJN5_HOYLO|nr:nucleotide exchange factor GrpE [Hoylesella loescheii]KDR52244.1 co-chaperone GrpE [Hoylesella loescheii DSM 19665 = JCM 12249 = ATCC 15930]